MVEAVWIASAVESNRDGYLQVRRDRPLVLAIEARKPGGKLERLPEVGDGAGRIRPLQAGVALRYSVLAAAGILSSAVDTVFPRVCGRGSMVALT